MKLEKRKKRNKQTKIQNWIPFGGWLQVQNPFLDLSKKSTIIFGFKNTDLDFSKEAKAVSTTLDCLALLAPYR